MSKKIRYSDEPLDLELSCAPWLDAQTRVAAGNSYLFRE
jgi:hypothetical protein